MKSLKLTLIGIFAAMVSFGNPDSEKLKAEDVFTAIEQMDERGEEAEELIQNLSFTQKVKLAKMAIKDVNSNGEFDVKEASVGMYIIAILLPPLAVALHTGLVGQTLLNVILTMLGYLPGLIHAIIVLGT